jgi:hypothetical protein
MPGQEPVTVRATVKAGELPALRAVLESGGLSTGVPGAPPPSLRLHELGHIHFARIFILDAATLQTGREVPASVVYMADVDGSACQHLRDLVTRAPAGVDDVFGHCEGYPALPEDSHRLAWLRLHALEPAAYYVHTAGRTVSQIKDEARLYSTLGAIVDSGEVVTAGQPPALVRSRLREAVMRRSDFSWVKKGPPGPGLVRELRDTVHLYGTLALLLVGAPFLLVPAAVWLLLVRLVELTDTQETGAPDQGHVDEVRRFEDVGVQNPFTAVGEVKSGVVRRVTMRVALAGLGFACRHSFHRDNLAGVTSIHFARWVPIDDGERLIFASSYDGSLESYMDDFISRLSWGINLVFSNGVGFPRARWLVFGGARDEISYKHYLRRHQAPTRVFYSAYPQHSAPNLDRFTAVRVGINRRDEDSAQPWLAQL